MTTTLHNIDRLTRVAFNSAPDWPGWHFTAPQGVFSNSASVIAHNDTQPTTEFGLRLATEGWSGIDLPAYQHTYTAQSIGEGERLLLSKVMPREITIPLRAPTNYNRAVLDRVLDPGTGPIAVGFDRSNQAQRSYLIGCHSIPSFNRRRRGMAEKSDFSVALRSQWGYFVRPHSLGIGGNVVVPAGVGRNIWLYRHVGPLTPKLTLTMTRGELGSTSRSWSWTPSPPGAPPLPSVQSLVVLFSPPFVEVWAGDFGNTWVPASAYRVEDTGFLPYLTPGTSYRLSSNQTGGTFYTLTNSLAP